MIDTSNESTLAKCDECEWWMHAVDSEHKRTARKALSEHRDKVHPGSAVRGPSHTERIAEQAARVRKAPMTEEERRARRRELDTKHRADPEWRARRAESNRRWREGLSKERLDKLAADARDRANQYYAAHREKRIEDMALYDGTHNAEINATRRAREAKRRADRSRKALDAAIAEAQRVIDELARRGGSDV